MQGFGGILASSLGIFIAAAFVMPAIDRYRAWKNGPREIVARRNWRGQYIPDLTFIRIERAFWSFWILLYGSGLVVLGVIFFG